MAISLKHSFTSAKSDGADTTLVQPSSWNAEHVLTQATSRVLGRVTGGAGVTEELTLSQVLDLVGSAAQGDILYRDATGWVRLAAGTSGFMLQTLGAGANPQWVRAIGVETIWVPAAAMVSRTTNGPATGTVETTTNKVMLRTLDFDTATQEFAQFAVRMPKSWNEGTVTARFVWSHASTATNFGVVWALEAVALSDAEAGDTAFGTHQQIADTGGTTNMVYITGATPAITVGSSPAAEDWVVFQVKRVPADGSDTMAIDARLHGVTLYITTDAATDD